MIEHARKFAEQAHQGQVRKVSKTPYIVHPIRVAKRLADNGASDVLISAAYLHDVVEDTPYEIEDIAAHFGQKVATIVAAHTEDKSKAWQERKQHTIDLIKDADIKVKFLIVADRLDNLIDLETDMKICGERIWDHFNAGFKQQKWYNKSIAENMSLGLEAEEIPAFFEEFSKTVKRVFGS